MSCRTKECPHNNLRVDLFLPLSYFLGKHSYRCNSRVEGHMCLKLGTKWQAGRDRDCSCAPPRPPTPGGLCHQGPKEHGVPGMSTACGQARRVLKASTVLAAYLAPLANSRLAAGPRPGLSLLPDGRERAARSHAACSRSQGSGHQNRLLPTGRPTGSSAAESRGGGRD